MESKPTYIKGDWYSGVPIRNKQTEKALAWEIALMIAGSGSKQLEIALEGHIGVQKYTDERFAEKFLEYCTKRHDDHWWEFTGWIRTDE